MSDIIDKRGRKISSGCQKEQWHDKVEELLAITCHSLPSKCDVYLIIERMFYLFEDILFNSLFERE